MLKSSSLRTFGVIMIAHHEGSLILSIVVFVGMFEIRLLYKLDKLQCPTDTLSVLAVRFLIWHITEDCIDNNNHFHLYTQPSHLAIDLLMLSQ